ncbi:hypothetical protein [Streptomyces sp. TRM68367]|nr:hypothetical protein [Streptomyces sp. TRM68367]
MRETVTPRAEHRERYDALYALYGQLYPETSATVHALAALQER